MFVLYNLLQADRIDPHHQQAWLNELPLEKRRQLEALPDQQDRLRSLIGLQLLKTGMRLCGELHFSLQSLSFGPRGKPDCDSRLHFSISHAQQLIACVVSTQGPVGVDLKPRTLPYRKTWDPYFTEQEIRLIHDHPQAFSGLWTQKESVVKAHGDQGLADIAQVRIDEKGARLHGRQWYIHTLNMHDDYSVHLACLHHVEEITYCQIEMP